MKGPLKFSIIIPLEFHRGVGARCIERWADIRRRRGDFELLLAAPASLPRREMALFEPHLGEQDRILVFDAEHDMALVAQAAGEARGEWLFFTESHVFPKPDLLERLEEVIAGNPGWGAFSCRSEPVVHNLLSRIEAGMYDEHIRRNLSSHPWLKVLDQCFAIRREAYEKSGGIEPEFGHFAEWLFAARLALAGVEVGYDELPAIEHYYIGRLGDLQEFTRDFARGECRFFLKPGGDAARKMFPPFRTPGREEIQGVRGLIGEIRSLMRFAVSDGVPARERLRAVGGMADAALRGSLGHRWEDLRLQIGIASARCRAWAALVCGREAAAKREFLSFLGRCAEAGRIEEARKSGLRHAMHPCWLEWTAFRPAPAGWLGFFDLEYWDNHAFSWLSAAGSLTFFDLGCGGCISFEIAGGLPRSRRILFEIDGAESASEFRENASGGTIRVKIPPGRRGRRRLRWRSVPLKFKGDWRRPCVAVQRVRVEQSREAISSGRSPERKSWCGLARRVEDAVAFIHIPKCAGTSMRLVLSNAWSAEENADPLIVNYRKPVCPGDPRLEGWRFIASHRMWLGAQWAEPPVVVTVLRNPVERLISLFNYSRALKLIPEATTIRQFEEFLKRDTTEWFQHIYFLFQEPGTTPGDVEAEAAANLARCAVVGVVEEMDSAIDLACWRLGIYPPKATPKINKTAPLTGGIFHLDREEISALEKLAAPDRAFYEEAKRLFERQRMEMMADLGIARAEEARKRLRERFFSRFARHPASDSFEWEPRDPFIGEGLYDLECHDGRFLRWTHGEGAIFYIPEIAGSGRLVAEVRVQNAGLGRLDQVEIRICGHPALCQFHLDGRQGMIVAEQQGEMDGEFQGVAAVEIRCPKITGGDDIRSLGVPLIGVRVYRQARPASKASRR